MLVERVTAAAADTGISRIVAGGGVAANSELRRRLGNMEGLQVVFPSMKLCTDNGAMVAGIGYHYLKERGPSSLGVNAASRVEGFRKTYP